MEDACRAIFDAVTTFLPPNFERRVPDGDTHERDVCGTCAFVHYVNPKIVTGAVVSHDGRLLLCRRAIEPRRGFWTIPAGYLETGESVEDGARREAREEAMAEIAIDTVLAIYSITRISQIQILFRATLADQAFAAGPESLEVRLFAWDEVPWNDLAFPSVHWALKAWHATRDVIGFAPFTNP